MPRAQTAASLVRQQPAPLELRAFEEEFVHTIKSFQENQKDKWARALAQHQEHLRDVEIAKRRPLFVDSTVGTTKRFVSDDKDVADQCNLPRRKHDDRLDVVVEVVRLHEQARSEQNDSSVDRVRAFLIRVEGVCHHDMFNIPVVQAYM